MPGIPADVDAIVMHALAKDRETRYQDAGSMRADCEAAMAGRPVSAEARGAVGAPVDPLHPSYAEAAAAAAAAQAATALPTEAIPYASEATQAMPVAADVLPGGLGAATLTSEGEGLGLPPGDLPGEEPPKPNRGPVIVLVVLAAIAAAVLLAVFGPKFWGGSPATPQVSVPPVTNLTQAQATAALTKVGLVAKVDPQPSDTVAKGEVSAQSPPAGTKVDPRASVTITVSTGPNTVRVPDVSGLSKTAATAALEADGLTVSTTDTVDSAVQDAGKVIDTDPAANKSVDKGSAVALHLASGKATVPNVVGQDNLSAAQKLTAAGFKVKQQLAPSDQPANQVIAQDHAGDVLKRGQTVTITVSNGTPATPTDTPSDTPTTSPPPTP